MEASNFTHSEKSMVNLIAGNQSLFCTSYEALIPNCYTQNDNEADLFAIRKSGICDEFEIKISRSDFFNDAKKIVSYRGCDWDGIDSVFLKSNPNWRHKNIIAPWQKTKYEALVDGDMHANYFWYILKDGIVSLDEVPAWAGVVFIDGNGDFKRGRQPTKLHKNKLDYEARFKLVRKTCYRFWEYRIGKR